MNFSTIHENPIIFLTWVTAIGMIISLIEATLKIKYENYIILKKREQTIRSLYPKKLA
tara:strand:+ start:1605 stop:1778 length:174 start_codon:yes stop_codon:yes gene_type:complete